MARDVVSRMQAKGAAAMSTPTNFRHCSILKADREKGDEPASPTQLYTPFTGDTIHRITEEVN